jgi:hypothetical protein
MNTKLGKDTAKADNENTELAAKEEASLSRTTFVGGELEGEFGSSDIQLPYLSLVNKTGQLSNEFTPGHFVYNKQVVVADGKAPMPITVLGMKKDYVEDIDFDADIMPRTFAKLADAQSEGYSIEYEAEKRVKPRACMLTLVPVPDDYGQYFLPIELMEEWGEYAGKVVEEPPTAFALAMWIVQSSAYTSVAKPVATARMSGHLRDGLHHGLWLLQSELKSYKQNSWMAPRIRAAGKHSPDFIKWLEAEVLPR